MKKTFMFFVLSFVFCSMALAQRTVTGTITDNTGLALIGANVIVKGTTNGVITDIDGNFSIEVPAGEQTLVFSYTGYATQEIDVGEQTSIDVILAEGVLLNEVVKVGYTTEQRQDIISSVGSVKAEEIESLPVQSFDRAIQGKVSGVQMFQASGAPGGAVNINIRGIGSINGGTQPLIIIDGVQMGTNGQSSQGSSNPLNALNPNDIESVEILKDAAATAIYGAQGANGIVVVTTKMGKRGQKAKISFSAQEGRVEPLNLYELMSAQQYADIRQAAFVNAGLPAQAAIDRYGDPNDPNLTSYDWVDAMFRTGDLRQYNLSASGGSDKMAYFAGFSYDYQEGQIIENNFERFTGRFNLNADLNDRLSMDMRLSLSRQDLFGSIANGNFVNGPFMAAFTSQPVSPAIDPETGAYNRYPVNGESHLFGYNILEGVNEEVRDGRTLQTIGNLGLTYDIMDGLLLTTSVGVDYVNNKDINNRPSTIPVFSGFGGQVFQRDRLAVNFNTTSTLQYNRELGGGQLSALAGYEYYQNDFELFNATGRGFADPYFRNLNSAATPQAVGGTSTTSRREGVFGSLKYNYDNKYYLGGSLRRDGSSRFGSANRYGVFWSVSAGYSIGKDLFPESTLIDNLKIRGSYGTTGNSNIGDFVAAATYGNGGQYLGSAALRPTRLANDLLGWETAEQANIALDFSFKDSRFYGSVDFWRKNNKDLLLATQIPISAGIANSNITENVGSVRNQGIDFELTTVNVNTGSFRWSTTANLSLQQNEVTSLTEERDTIFAGNTPSLVVGQPVNFFYLLEFAGVNPANGRPMVYNSDGIPIYSPTFSDGNIVGSPIPDWYGGITNTVDIGSFSVSAFFQFQVGHEAFNGDLYNLAGSGDGPNNQLARESNYWKQPGDLTNTSKPIQGGALEGVDHQFGFIGTTRFMSDASYIRLKELRASYVFRNQFLAGNGIGNINVFVTGLNLWTKTNYDGIDPEVVSANNNTGASSFGVYPLGKQYSAGLKIEF